MLKKLLSDTFSMHIFNDKSCNLLGIIALDKKNIYPALGGTRFIKYLSIDEAIMDAVRLSRNMTLKCILSEVPFFGGKAVLLHSDPIDKGSYFSAYGDIIESFNGRFITGCDSGVDQNDMRISRKKTKYITGLSSDENLDYLSYLTALGVLEAMKLALIYNDMFLEGSYILIQGVGKVGRELVKLLKERGANVTIFDLDEELAKKVGKDLDCRVIKNDEMYEVECDVFSPCGFGGILNEKTISSLKCHIICGAANNQMYDPTLAVLLDKRNIFYIPDWICNIGGTIYAAHSYLNDDIVFIKNKVISVIQKRTKDFIILKNSEKIGTFETSNIYMKHVLEEA